MTDPEPQPPGASRRVRRFWSDRRVPATITAALVLGGSGLLLYDVSAVRAGHTAMAWRRQLADELATRPLNDLWILLGAGAAMLLGLWLVVLALTPGLRSLLPMQPAAGPLRPGLDRAAAGLLVRERALEVPGIRSVRVVVTRRRITVHADSHFRDPDEVRSELDTALDDAVHGLGLARPPTLTCVVRRAGRE